MTFTNSFMRRSSSGRVIDFKNHMIMKVPKAIDLLSPNSQAFQFYLKSGKLKSAREVFDQIPNPDLRSLTLLISAYTRRNLPRDSISLYWKVKKEKNLKPDNLVLLSVAKACASSLDLVKAKELHEEAIKYGIDSDLLLGNAMIDMYGKCGSCGDAQSVFDKLPQMDVISWTSLVSAYVNCRLPLEGLQVFRDMQHSGNKPNAVTLSTVLRACSELNALRAGIEIHCYALKIRLDADAFVCSGLMDVYANSLRIQHARTIFDRIQRKDIVSWIVMLSAYFSNGEDQEALKLFDKMKNQGMPMSLALWNCMISGLTQQGRVEQAFSMLYQMQHLGFKPDEITMASILPAFSCIENLRGGREIHGYIYRHWFMGDVTVSTSLLVMYAKCGDLCKSSEIFHFMPIKDIVAWNTMIMANAMHGHGKEALSLYFQMLESGMRPNAITFMAVLKGCSHSQLINEARSVFNSMSRDHELAPNVSHYACMVDVLCRAGHLEEAYDFIQNMPMEPTATAWGSLLASSRVYKNIKLGKIAAKQLFDIEPENPGNYVQLSNILLAAKQWDDASEIRTLMRDKMRNIGVPRVPGYSWIQVKNKVYTFVKGDDKNPQREDIYNFLKEIGKKMKLEGYIPDTDLVLQNVHEQEKEELLCNHSEKLAVAFGVLNLKGGSVIRVFKNLRICGDCHNVIKFIAKIVGVQIIVRDNLRFHHFRDGSCSCKEFW